MIDNNKKSIQKKTQDTDENVSLLDVQLPPFKNEEVFDKMGNILSQDQLNVLRKIKNNLKLHYETTQLFRSEVEMRFSVLNNGKFPTPDAKYWQAVREKNVHYINLAMLTYSYESDQIKIKNLQDMIKKNNVKIKRFVKKIEDDQNITDLDREEIEIDIDIVKNKINSLTIEQERLKFFQAEKRREAYNRWREIVTWEKIIMELVPKMKFGILSYEHHQAGSYERRMENQYQTMIKSGAKASPSEAINITNQNNTIKQLIKDGVLDPNCLNLELPINKAVREVVCKIENGNNYIDNKYLIGKRSSNERDKNILETTEYILSEEKEEKEENESIKQNVLYNPQVPVSE